MVAMFDLILDSDHQLVSLSQTRYPEESVLCPRIVEQHGEVRAVGMVQVRHLRNGEGTHP